MFIKGHISGVYKIICLPTGKIYIGSSVNIFDRWTIHKSGLRNNKHYNPHLQKAWNKYKENNFNFEIIEKVDNNFLTEKENFWIEKFNSRNNKYGFNIAKPGDIRHRTNPGMTGRSHSEKSKLKMSLARIGRVGYKHTQEDKIRLSLALKGKKRSKIAIKNMTKAQKLVDRRGSKNPKAKLVDKNIPEIRKMKKEGRSTKEIANKYNVSIDAIYDIINGRKWRHIP